MSEYEMMDSITSLMQLYLAQFLAFITILSAYLIAAFISGNVLSHQQFIIFTVLFLFSAGLVVLAMWGAASRIAHMADVLRVAFPDHPIIFTDSYRNALTGMCTLGILASLKFMWDTRSQERE